MVSETTKLTKRYTLASINELVDEMFPPVRTGSRKGVEAGAGHRRALSVVGLSESEDFGDASFWRNPIPAIDLDDLP